jgi:hypothetical protein
MGSAGLDEFFGLFLLFGQFAQFALSGQHHQLKLPFDGFLVAVE